MAFQKNFWMPLSAAVKHWIYALTVGLSDDIKEGALNTVMLLKKYGADVNTKCHTGLDSGYYVRMTPIMMAVNDEIVGDDEMSASKVVTTLLKLGANPYVKDSKGQNAFDYLRKNSEIKKLSRNYFNQKQKNRKLLFRVQ